MSQIRNVDILLEMMELSTDLMGEVRQQLTYFRASVYKDEAAEYVRSKISHLRFIVKLFSNDLMLEPFLDYDAELENCTANYIPGECSFSSRVARLLENLEKQIVIQRKLVTKRSSRPRGPNDSINRHIRSQRKELLAICKHGSRHWSFFQRI